jgi:hypothetical protein
LIIVWALIASCATSLAQAQAGDGSKPRSKREMRDGGAALANHPAFDELLRFEFEGITLDMPLKDVPRVLAKAGYQQNPRREKYLLEFYRGELTPNGAPAVSFSTRPGGSPGYVIRVQTDLELKTGLVKSIQLTRPSAPRYGPPFAEALPDSLDVKLARDFKAIVCRHISDERERWAACPPDSERRVELRNAAQAFRRGAQMIRSTMNVTAEAGSIGLGLSP